MFCMYTSSMDMIYKSYFVKLKIPWKRNKKKGVFSDEISRKGCWMGERSVQHHNDISDTGGI